MKKLNSRGAALANIMLISAFVMVLASTIVQVAMSNYRMKLVNINSKNNFYSCESILDEMRVGFRNKMVHYYASSDEEEFRNLYTEFTLLKADGGAVQLSGQTVDLGPRFYDLAKVVSLVTNIDGQSTSWTAVQEEGKVYPTEYKTQVTVLGNVINVSVSTDMSAYNLFYNAEYVLFKNITVTYEQNGYKNAITSDIKLWYGGDVIEDGERLNDYSVVTRGSIYIYDDNGTNIQFEGSVYAAEVSNRSSFWHNTENWKHMSSSDWAGNPGYYAMYLRSPEHSDKTTTVKIGGEKDENGNVKKTKKAVFNGSIIIGQNTVLDVSDCEKVYINGNIVFLEDKSGGFKKGELKVGDAQIIVTDRTITPMDTYKSISSESTIFKDVYSSYFPEKNVQELENKQYPNKTYWYDIGLNGLKNFKQSQNYATIDNVGYKIDTSPNATTNLDDGKVSIVINCNESSTLQNGANTRAILLSNQNLSLDGPDYVVIKKVSDEQFKNLMSMTVVQSGLPSYSNENLTGHADTSINNILIPVDKLIQPVKKTQDPLDGGGSATTAPKHTNLAISYDNWQRN